MIVRESEPVVAAMAMAISSAVVVDAERVVREVRSVPSELTTARA